jgi:hypothetical protein
VRRQEQAETTENETGYWRVALLAYDLAGRTLTDEQVVLDMSIHRRCEDVDQGSLASLDRAREHLERYDAAQSADPR